MEGRSGSRPDRRPVLATPSAVLCADVPGWARCLPREAQPSADERRSTAAFSAASSSALWISRRTEEDVLS